MNNTVILSSDACLGHVPGPEHPECPDRLIAVREALAVPEFESVPWRHAPLGTRGAAFAGAHARVRSPHRGHQTEKRLCTVGRWRHPSCRRGRGIAP